MLLIESKKFCVNIIQSSSIIDFNSIIGFWNELAHTFMPLGYINLIGLNNHGIYSNGALYISEKKHYERYYIRYIHDIGKRISGFEAIPKNRLLVVKGNFYGKIKIYLEEYLNKNHANNRE